MTAIFLMFYVLLRFSTGVKSIITRIKGWFSNRQKILARKQTISGLYDFVEGNWIGSEKKLSHAAKHSDMSLINYLAAAYAAQLQQAPKRRDNYLLLAQKAGTDRPIAIGLTQARLKIFNRQWEEALAILQRLHRLQPKNVFVLQLLIQMYSELKDWYSLKFLLSTLRKYHVFSAEEINQLELKVYRELLLIGITNNTMEVKWDELPRYLQKHPTLVAIYAEYLLANNQTEAAEIVLKLALRKTLDERLLKLYAALPDTNSIKKITRAEGWLKTNPENAALLLCLGRICKQQKLWGKARQYLEKSISLTPTPTAYSELGQIMEMQKDLSSALDFYSKGLQAVINEKI